MKYRAKAPVVIAAVKATRPLTIGAGDWVLISDDDRISVVSDDYFRQFYEPDKSTTPLPARSQNPKTKDRTDANPIRRTPRRDGGETAPLPPNLGRALPGIIMRTLREISTEQPMKLLLLRELEAAVKKAADKEIYSIKVSSISASLSGLVKHGYVDYAPGDLGRQYAITVRGLDMLKKWETEHGEKR